MLRPHTQRAHRVWPHSVARSFPSPAATACISYFADIYGKRCTVGSSRWMYNSDVVRNPLGFGTLRKQRNQCVGNDWDGKQMVVWIRNSKRYADEWQTPMAMMTCQSAALVNIICHFPDGFASAYNTQLFEVRPPQERF